MDFPKRQLRAANEILWMAFSFNDAAQHKARWSPAGIHDDP
ncbi:hypothetical protein Z949_314 [Sulfitobacter guttiformis KCTC 32187]|nr:hypothetical protein Z949_314 [Sulfitobacter guttiformis KCTC 32187]